MKTLRISLFAILVIFLGSSQIFGQINIPDFSERVNKYIDNNRGELVYLQTDREVYYGGDRLNFKAFIRDFYSLEANSKSKNLHLILVDPFGNLQQEKIFEVSSNQSSGNMDILDGLPSGEYKLIAWTNEMESGPVQRVFTKKIFINEKLIPPVFIKLSAGQTTYLPGDIGQVKVELSNNLGRPVKRKKFSYTLSHNGSILSSESGRTDKEGKANIDINVPDIQELGILVFEIAVEQLGSNTLSNIVVPTSKTPVWIEFVPEGGLFVNGLETLIGFKTYNYMGRAIDIEGEVLDSDNKLVTKIKSEGMGFGSFRVKADASNPMKVRISKPAGIDMEYPLPDVQKDGISLSLREKTDDMLKFHVATDIEEASVSLHAVATSGGTLIFEKRFNLSSASELDIPFEKTSQHRLVDVNLLNRSGDVLAHRSVFIACENPLVLESEHSIVNFEEYPLDLEFRANDNNFITAPAEFAASVSDNIMAPYWNPVPDIMSWFMFGPSADLAAFTPGLIASPSETEEKIIDSYLLFHMDDKYDWPNIKTGRKANQPFNKQEFRDDLKQYYQTSDFEKLISQIRANEFFRIYFTGQIDPQEYINKNKAELEKSGYLPLRMSTDEKVQLQLQQGKSIMSVLMSIKPYKLMDNKIVFRGNDSYNYQGGAIIVIDGIMRGTDPGILSGISPYDVESIKASANIADIQKYSGLNSTGVVEITTKKARGSDQPMQAPQTSFPTLAWDSKLFPDANGSLKIKIEDPPIWSNPSILIQGIDANGNFLIWTNK